VSETLRQQQSRFALAVSGLIAQAYAMGYEVTLGDAYRDPRVFGPMGTAKGYGRADSQHKQRLAIDLNLFRDGRFLSSTESHRPLGEWWERQFLDARWGGRWGDGNHYSLERGGFK
jgi:hypothetical protein